MATGSIVDLCGQYIVDVLTASCSTAVTASAQAAGLVRQGLFQDDPTRYRISLLVSPGDPDETSPKPAWADCLATPAATGFFVPTYEVGGGVFWLRRFTALVEQYFTLTLESRDEARSIATWVFSNAHKALQAAMGCNILDEFGERTTLMLVPDMIAYESGGPPNSFIWKGKFYVQFLTEKP